MSQPQNPSYSPTPSPDLHPPHSSQGEIALSRELLPVTPRFIAYGNVSSGAADLVGEIRDELADRGRADLDVFRSYNVVDIEHDFFFGRGHPMGGEGHESTRAAITAGALALTEGDDKQKSGSILRRAASMLSRGEQPSAQDAPKPEPTLPAGVMVFPEMRQYMHGYIGMTIETPYKRIEDLCAKYGVPFVYVEKLAPGELGRTVGELVAKLPELPPAE